MNQALKLFCCLVYVISAVVNAAPRSKLPNGFIQCKKSDPELDECLMNGFRKGLPHLVKGVPSLGLIKIDPLRIIKLNIEQNEGPVSINLTFHDLDIINMKNTVLTRLHYDPDTYNLQFEAAPYTLKLEGNYEVNGKVLVFPILGKGKSKFRIDLLKVFTNVQMKPIVRKGTTYLNIEKISWKFTTKHLDMKLDNLFNGDKALGENLNLFLNENWREILVELQPVIEQVLGVAFKQIGQQFLKRVPLDQILLD